jgi:hypothetical protein
MSAAALCPGHGLQPGKHRFTHGMNAVAPAPITDDLVDRACATGLAGILKERINESGARLSPVQLSSLRSAAAGVAAANLRMIHELERILAAFERADVPVMLLKGAALHQILYDRPELRPMSDLDLLVRPHHVEPAIRALGFVGYRRGMALIRDDFFPRFYYEAEFVSDLPGAARIDLHVRPFRPLRIAQTMPDEALWQGAVRVHVGDAAGWIPTPEMMFLHLAVHAAFHGCNRLVWLYDLARFAHCQGATLNWDLIMGKARVWRLSLPLRRAIERTAELFGPICTDTLRQELARHSAGWRDRLTLAHAPRDAAHPLTHLFVNLLCVRGVAMRLGLLRAFIWPSPSHLGGIYPFRHLGWRWAAQVWRMCRAMIRIALPRAA